MGKGGGGMLHAGGMAPRSAPGWLNTNVQPLAYLHRGQACVFFFTRVLSAVVSMQPETHWERSGVVRVFDRTRKKKRH